MLNTFSSAVARIDDEVKHLLDKDPDKIPEDIKAMFYQKKFIVDDECDEKRVLSYHFDKDKYNISLRDLEYTVTMTYACNLSCPYCCQGTKKDTKTFDTEKVSILLKNIEKNLRKKDFREVGISLYGGEPLLAYQQCIQLVEGVLNICKEQTKGLRVDITTNGTLITKEVIDNLLGPYCGKVQITMDGNRETHDKRKHYHEGTGTYDTLLNVLELLKDANINTSLRLNIDRKNVNDFSGLLQDLKSRSLEDIPRYLGWIYPADTEAAKGAGYAQHCFTSDHMIAREDSISQQLGVKRVSDEILLPLTLTHEPCPFDREDSYIVDPYLDVYNCKEFIGQKDKKVGYIDKDGEMILHYEYYEQMSRNPLDFAECNQCVYVPFCAGGCARRAYLETGTYHSAPCAGRQFSLKTLIDKGMKKYMKKVADQQNR